MEWAIGIPILLLVLACPLMMVGMVVGGWLFGRRFLGGQGGHGGQGMMMCMGHTDSPGGESGQGSGVTGRDPRPETKVPGLVEELKLERARLDELIARAEGGR